MSKPFGNACAALLGLFILARGAVALLPAGPWSPSGYQCGSYYLFLPLARPHSCTADAAFGEGARVANRLDFVTFRREKFTVDERGYRNLPSGRKPRVILFGSSFSLGLSLSDEATLSAQLSRELGSVVYNASDVLSHALSAEPLNRAAKSLNMQNGWVLLEVLNRAPYYWMPSPPETSPRRIARQLVDAAAPLQSIERRIRYPMALARVSSLLNMRLENDVLLPNPDRFRFPEEELTDGRHMLFYLDDKGFFENPADPRPTSDAIRRLSDDLARDGLKLAVMMVPTGYSVYYPLLRRKSRVSSSEDTASIYMATLARQLTVAGIPAFNCLPAMRDAAARELTGGRLLYWPDDAHWNPLGVETAARALAPWFRSLTDVVQ